MINLFKALSLLSAWSVLVAVVIYIDPVTIKNILVPNAYLPMTTLVGVVVGYTTWQFVQGWKWVVITLFVTLITGLLLLL
ncbi:MAG: hypothetical protein E6P95_00865 [Candidatus Moraniibacteriota bacterium]|nr:MAG: hypothetical protein E6P95_00865 [Candidatus Moranbacteria bacterium]